jgi:DNA-binding NarL/FixJ family response regulator
MPGWSARHLRDMASKASLLFSGMGRGDTVYPGLDAQSNATLAIVDLNLPKKSGREALECMRVSAICRHLPVVILSSSDARVAPS